MTRIVWSRTVLPDPGTPCVDLRWPELGNGFETKRARAIPQATPDIVSLPDRKAYRSMTRAAVLLCAAGLPARETLTPYLERDAFRVGLYCAVENGANDYASCKELLGVEQADFSEAYRKLRNPKQYLKQLPNLAAGQLGIFLGVMGPLSVFTHSRFGCLHALEAAEADLSEGLIDAALVCSAFSLEDPLVCERERRSMPPDSILAEGAAAIVVTTADAASGVLASLAAFDIHPFLSPDVASATDYFGISNPLIKSIERLATPCPPKPRSFPRSSSPSAPS